jgi:hypothetical protein
MFLQLDWQDVNCPLWGRRKKYGVIIIKETHIRATIPKTGSKLDDEPPGFDGDSSTFLPPQ